MASTTFSTHTCGNCGHGHIADEWSNGTTFIHQDCDEPGCNCESFNFFQVKRVAMHPEHRELKDAVPALAEDNAKLRADADELTRRAASAHAHLHYLSGILDLYAASGESTDPLDVRVRRLGDLTDEQGQTLDKVRRMVGDLHRLVQADQPQLTAAAIANGVRTLVDLLIPA